MENFVIQLPDGLALSLSELGKQGQRALEELVCGFLLTAFASNGGEENSAESSNQGTDTTRPFAELARNVLMDLQNSSATHTEIALITEAIRWLFHLRYESVHGIPSAAGRLDNALLEIADLWFYSRASMTRHVNRVAQKKSGDPETKILHEPDLSELEKHGGRVGRPRFSEILGAVNRVPDFREYRYLPGLCVRMEGKRSSPGVIKAASEDQLDFDLLFDRHSSSLEITDLLLCDNLPNRLKKMADKGESTDELTRWVMNEPLVVMTRDASVSITSLIPVLPWTLAIYDKDPDENTEWQNRLNDVKRRFKPETVKLERTCLRQTLYGQNFYLPEGNGVIVSLFDIALPALSSYVVRDFDIPKSDSNPIHPLTIKLIERFVSNACQFDAWVAKKIGVMPPKSHSLALEHPEALKRLLSVLEYRYSCIYDLLDTFKTLENQPITSKNIISKLPSTCYKHTQSNSNIKNKSPTLDMVKKAQSNGSNNSSLTRNLKLALYI